MGFLSKLLRVPPPIDIMRANLFMEYNPLIGTGAAAVEWVYLGSSDPNLRPFWVTLLYARILTAHSETRTKLFELVDVISKQNVRDEGRTGFGFPEWTLPIGFGAPMQRIWPWVFVASPGDLSKPKVYNATMQVFPGSSRFGFNLKMAFGQERILAPASVLIAITSYVEATDREGCYELAVLLWQVNEFYISQGRIRMGSESAALAAATIAMKSGNLRIP